MSRRWFPGSLRSRPLPAFGRTPPFHCRFTGEKSVLFAPPSGLRPYSPVPLPFHGGEVLLTRSLFGFLPHGAVSGVGEWPVRAEGARSGGPP